MPAARAPRNWFGRLLDWWYDPPHWRARYGLHEGVLVKLTQRQARLVGPHGWYLVHDPEGRTRFVGHRREDAQALAEAWLVCPPEDRADHGPGDPGLPSVLLAEQQAGVPLLTRAGRAVVLYPTPWERRFDVYDGRPTLGGEGLGYDPVRGRWVGKLVPQFLTGTPEDPHGGVGVLWRGQAHHIGELVTIEPQPNFRRACERFGATLDQLLDHSGYDGRR